ncbi:MaoC family dehydratase [Pseudoteredinibacter isoporae]|uniref:Acyl dehydratase n=1 Tax=Pseudoteredinibacter isoporae TaxID=570281 RepID=A0A7X0JTA6_9GAMM|nr:MaoC family dehydratase [Pseudoteredinibacter isoporae]MBB6520941.1 acyl dehydratase [Pseudoteredinibacter isoporae]NHO86506.1 MaoC family dehydratase [Pseudoteredinibacter isoporae]NIB25042.1 MaoC family dehydratase [Pseudoteredinibacter isoporae]
MSDIQVGSQIPALELAPISRYTLALFAGASGDHNPIHIDIDFAKAAGMPDVFAHGMLSMAYLGRMLTNWQPQAKLKTFNNKFAAITQLQDVITCSGKVVELLEQEGKTLARCEIQAAKASGEQTLLGEALVEV